MKSSIYKHSRVNEVAGKVGEGLDRRALKAVRRNFAPQESIGDLLGLCKVSVIVIDMFQYLNLPWLQPSSDMSPARPSELLTMPFCVECCFKDKQLQATKMNTKANIAPC